MSAKKVDVESKLLQRVASGDASAFEECIDCYGGLIWSLARRMISARSDAEDAVQEVFIDIWKSAGRYDPQVASEQTFVATIARRRFIDRRRRQLRALNTAPYVPVEAMELATGHVGHEQVDLADESIRAQAALAELRPEQQEILRLSVFDGWSHQRIADHLQIPLGTVKTHVRRGLIQVREAVRGSQASDLQEESNHG